MRIIFFYVVFICEETELIDLMGNWLTNSLIHVYQGVCPPQEGAVQSFGGLYSSERLENVSLYLFHYNGGEYASVWMCCFKNAWFSHIMRFIIYTATRVYQRVVS